MSRSPVFALTSRPSIVSVTSPGAPVGSTYSYDDGHWLIGTPGGRGLCTSVISSRSRDRDRGAGRTGAAHLEDLLAEEAVEAHDGRHRARSHRADGGLRERRVQARHDRRAERQHEVEVLWPAEAVRDAEQHALEPGRPFAAGGALATALVREELEEPPRDERGVGVLVEDHDR